MSDTKTTGSAGLSPLRGAAAGYARALGDRLVDRVSGSVGGLSDRLTSFAENGGKLGGGAKEATEENAEQTKNGESPAKGGLAGVLTSVKDKVKQAFGRGRGGKSKAFKFNNIVESFDIGAPNDVVFSAWTDYDQWPSFMKKLEHAELDPDEAKAKLKGQVFWSHREWETTITDQIPGNLIKWDSTGAKGHISGVVTFHPLLDDLTRVAMVLEYHPQGFMEKTANIWRAANRRVRLELKLFVRHVMNDVALNPDDVEGYWAEIHEGEVTRTHEEVRKEMDSDRQNSEQDDETEEEQA